MDLLTPLTLMMTVLALVLLLLISRNGWLRGRLDEWWLDLGLRRFLDARHYFLFSHVTLPGGQGSTQIDYLVVSPYGLFVVDVRNLRGWIFGGADKKLWTLQHGREKQRFQNPVEQHQLQLATLQSLLGLQEDQIHLAVVFVGRCSFKSDVPDNVIKGGLTAYIKRYQQECLSQAQMTRVINAIEQHRLESTPQQEQLQLARLEHWRQQVDVTPAPMPAAAVLASVPPHESEATVGIAPVCPQCGSPMILRVSQNGTNRGNRFWRCSAYPQCRGVISNIS